ncbi:hypothetical protein EV384_2355 [Micromonospora kangleipakensis]|uniref:CU044_5270 family protein n=1 Tax=Micromonospora kangleipakensis TaxID=1077942 RepID=A0A4Q8B9P3_9ACTN|nr:hypothetical protein [Micromonospora kangleipakensis]RZU73921.1 hypothetical protein EV384_2355 [Micromonospora kangleipakensis]
MSRTEPDLVAVRDLPPGRPEPTDESVSRTWYTIIHRLSDRRLRSRRWLVPVTAAAVVAALVVGAVTLFAPDRTPPAPLNPRQVMDRLIDKAARIEPVEVPPGQLLYVRAENTQRPGRAVPGTTETWFDGQTVMPLRVRVDGTDTSVDGPDKPGSTAEDNRNIVAAGGNWYFPTPGWLARAPTEPAALFAQLGKESFGAFTDSRPEREWEVIAILAGLLSRAEPRLSPELRVGLYRLIADLDGLVASEVTVDGRRCWAVGLTTDTSGGTAALLFDQGSGRVIGKRDVQRQGPGPGAPAPSGGPTSVQETRWTFAVVPDTNRTE